MGPLLRHVIRVALAALVVGGFGFVVTPTGNVAIVAHKPKHGKRCSSTRRSASP